MSGIMLLWLSATLLAIGIVAAAATWGRYKKVGSEASIALLLASALLLPMVFMQPVILFVAFAVQAWLMVLPTRLLFGRLEPQFLMISTRRNAAVGVGAVAIVSIINTAPGVVFNVAILAGSMLVCIVIGLFFLWQLLQNTRHYKIRPMQSDMLSQNAVIPTVSVCIPARNETHALTDCLQRVLASDYQRLEVLVLDDCSQDTTAAIIKSFAHDGVRFVQGEVPAAGWLGKAQAMNTLAQYASGQYIMFIDVDTHIEPQSISRLMAYIQAHKLQMLSVLPQNRLGIHSATLGGTLEYFWRLVLPRTKSRVPVSSKAWIINAASLRQLGGFSAVKRKIVPEEMFAYRFTMHNAYRFIVSNEYTGITTAKRYSSQIETAIRLLYPRFRRQPFIALIVVIAIFMLLILPLVLSIFLAINGVYGWQFILAVAATICVYASYCIVLMRTQPRSWLVASVLLPFIALQEIVLCIASMLLYEFGQVNWKGRNVCYPVVTPVPVSRRQA